MHAPHPDLPSPLPTDDAAFAATPGFRVSPMQKLPLQELAPDIRRLSKVSETRGLATVARQWIVIGLAAGVTIYTSSWLGPAWWLVYAMAVLVIATRQHALLGVLHEATHFRVSRHRAWNDFVSDMFCAYPVGLSTEIYRRSHMLHHQHTNTENDPDWVGMGSHEDWRWPKDHVTALRMFALDLCGLAAHKVLLLLFLWSPLQAAVIKHTRLSSSERLRLVTFIGCIFVALTVLGGWKWFALLWLVPMCTFFGALIRLRSVAEHLVCPSEHELNETRHVEATWIEKMTLAPVNVNYHLAHHLFPSVPWYNLPALHERLMQVPTFRDNAHITRGYLNPWHGVLSEVIKAKEVK